MFEVLSFGFGIMYIPSSSLHTVLITGGTSGLGYELVKLFLKKGFKVVATGRKPVSVEGFSETFKLFIVDFSNLGQTADTVKTICNSYKFDVVINNAGILSPPDLIITRDSLEYTFQVNFLSHLLLNEIIIRNCRMNSKSVSVVVTSPVYRNADRGLGFSIEKNSYRPLKAYSASKLFLALMVNHFSEIYSGSGMKFIVFDPGVFRSGIFRMQRKWFRAMYRVGAPFMKNPCRIALTLAGIIEKEDLQNGSVYDFRGRIRSIPEIDNAKIREFWKECYDRIEKFC